MNSDMKCFPDNEQLSFFDSSNLKWKVIFLRQKLYWLQSLFST